jgi:hypothetical protein
MALPLHLLHNITLPLYVWVLDSITLSLIPFLPRRNYMCIGILQIVLCWFHALVCTNCKMCT